MQDRNLLGEYSFQRKRGALSRPVQCPELLTLSAQQHRTQLRAMFQFLVETFSLWDLDPLHVSIEAICVIIIVYLWLQKSYKIRERPETLTEKVHLGSSLFLFFPASQR